MLFRCPLFCSVSYVKPFYLYLRQTPLVFIGHSMGGLVIKRAFIFAKQKEEFLSIANRVRAILFLATPHRGSDFAPLLSKVLSFSGSRPFVADLHRNSLVTQSINDEFPHHCRDLQLYSFYETLPTSYGVGKGLIVDKDLAVLGYSNERTAYLHASHREVCKYSTPTDPNYITVRNALASTVDDIRRRALSPERDLDREKLKFLDSFSIADVPEDDLMGAINHRMIGSCEWLLKRGSFLNWRDSANTQLYWMSAKPGAGKTILSGSVITDLRGLDRDCAFYFFNHGNKEKSTIGSFLLSMAWQMARMHKDILNTFIAVSKDNRLSTANYRIIWRRLFIEGVFGIRLARPQYWVVDALDECQAGSDLVPLLLKVMESCPVRIFASSRDRYEIHKQILPQNVRVISETLTVDDTKSDILLYLQAHIDQLPSDESSSSGEMVTKILTNSDGSFLWVTLILSKLRHVHTSTEIRQVLEDVPSDMDKFYSRILDSMWKTTYGKALTKAILRWTVCSARPLTTEELHSALQLDIGDAVDNVRGAIDSNCDQLVFIDSQSRVKLVHETAREFLLRPNGTSEFAIDKCLGHRQLAMVCLQYLSGSEMKVRRCGKLTARNIAKQRSSFLNYAATALYEHLLHISKPDTEFLALLAKFLSSSNVLSWIEYIAKHSDLNRVIQTGKALRKLSQKGSTCIVSPSQDMVLIDSWAIDLGRLVIKFGKNLSAYPSSIFNLIPPFCPSESAPRKQFAASAREITVLGLGATTWDDCLATIVDRAEKFTALACSDDYFAIGMGSGKIAIFNEETCQQVQKLKHDEAVTLLEFGATKRILASASRKSVCVWRTESYERVWRFDIPQPCLSLALTDADQLLLGMLKNNKLVIWDLIEGTLRDTMDLAKGRVLGRPISAAFCLENYLLAVAYKGPGLLLWDLEKDTIYDTYDKENGSRLNSGKWAYHPGVRDVVFGAGRNANLLAATYRDGDLVLFDTSDGEVKEATLANVHTLASSSSGRTIAGKHYSGTIQLFDFETLKLLYRIDSVYGLEATLFNGDSHRLLDIRGSQCRIWDPTALLRQDTEDEITNTISASHVAQGTPPDPSRGEILVTSLVCSERGDAFFCGKEDGSVYLYDTRSARQAQRLFSHGSGVDVAFLYFDEESQIITSSDLSSLVLSHRLSRQPTYWEASEPIFNIRAGVVINQILCGRGHKQILVSTTLRDVLWSISPPGNTAIASIERKDRASYKWATHPANPDQLILISGAVAHIYEWQTLRRLTDDDGILLESSASLSFMNISITACDGKIIATAFREPSRAHASPNTLLWNVSDFSLGPKKATPIPGPHSLTEQVSYIIGACGQKLVFLQNDAWVCSVDSHCVGNVVRHFFLPSDWLSTYHGLIIDVTSKGDVIFIKGGEVVVIKRGLDNIEESIDARGLPILGRERQTLI
jgi:WD40 repeat protein